MVTLFHPASPLSALLRVVCAFSQSVLLVSVTGTGGNSLGTGAEGGSGSPEAALGPTPDGLHVDTGPSEGEAQLQRGADKGENVNDEST